jgi:hypothetical protein
MTSDRQGFDGVKVKERRAAREAQRNEPYIAKQ